MKTRTLSEELGLVEPRASVRDRILGLGQLMSRKEAELDKKSFKEQMVVIVPVAFLGVYLGLGIIRCGAVILSGAKVAPDMFLDWWWVFLMKLIS